MAARKQFLLRVDPELWKELERWAADELRSVNAQVEWVPRRVKQREGRAAAPVGAARLDQPASERAFHGPGNRRRSTRTGTVTTVRTKPNTVHRRRAPCQGETTAAPRARHGGRPRATLM
jgi:hypothetical protein